MSLVTLTCRTWLGGHSVESVNTVKETPLVMISICSHMTAVILTKALLTATG